MGCRHQRRRESEVSSAVLCWSTETLIRFIDQELIQYFVFTSKLSTFPNADQTQPMTLLHGLRNLNPTHRPLQNPYVHVLHDIYGALPGLWNQWKIIPYSWHLVFLIAAINLLGIIDYAWGSNIGNRGSIEDVGLIVHGLRGDFIIRNDRDQVEKEKRMGMLGRPEGGGGLRELKSSGTQGQIKVAVVCPVLVVDLKEDISALQRVHQSLCNQTRRPDLILFIDDGSPSPTVVRSNMQYCYPPEISERTDGTSEVP